MSAQISVKPTVDGSILLTWKVPNELESWKLLSPYDSATVVGWLKHTLANNPSEMIRTPFRVVGTRCTFYALPPDGIRRLVEAIERVWASPHSY